MLKYLIRSGAVSAVVGAVTLMRSLRDEEFTWRSALAWVSWAISAALTIGAVVDMRRERRGKPIPSNSPVADAKVAKREKAMRRARS